MIKALCWLASISAGVQKKIVGGSFAVVANCMILQILFFSDTWDRYCALLILVYPLTVPFSEAIWGVKRKKKNSCISLKLI